MSVKAVVWPLQVVRTEPQYTCRLTMGSVLYAPSKLARVENRGGIDLLKGAMIVRQISTGQMEDLRPESLHQMLWLPDRGIAK